VTADIAGRHWTELLPRQLRSERAFVGLLVGLGLAVRLFNYVRNPSLWHDEAALVLNVIHQDFSHLLGPLLYAEAAPPLFLWAERAAVLLLGDSTFALRLLPFLAGCGSLLLFVYVARSLLPPRAVPWAVLLFALNDHLLWHAGEAKPYSIDVLLATGLLALWCATRRWPLERRLLAYAISAPFTIWIVYPGSFLMGGVVIAVLPALWLERARARCWLAYGTLVLAVAVAFLLLYAGPARAQRNAAMDACWTTGFPPWGQGAWAFAVWVVKSTLDALCYCCAPVGNVLAPVIAAGSVALWRRGERASQLLLLVPAGLALVAACVGGYPFGGSRVLVYMAPAVVLLLAAGIPPALDWLAARSRLAAAALVLVVLVAVGTACRSTALPAGRPDVAAASRFVLAGLQPGDLVMGNAWENDYYFRHLQGEFVPGVSLPRLPDGGLWLVVVAATAGDRDAVSQAMTPAGWEPVVRREFARTTVVLLRRPAAPPPTAGRQAAEPQQ
jgi:hypothetical protein